MFMRYDYCTRNNRYVEALTEGANLTSDREIIINYYWIYVEEF